MITTGRTDKNGKDIFLGEKVKVPVAQNGKVGYEIFEVIWDEKVAGFGVQTEDGFFNMLHAESWEVV